MKPDKGTVHISAILIGLVMVAALVYFKDEVKVYISEEKETVSQDNMDSPSLSDTWGEEREEASLFGSLLTPGQPVQEKPAEPAVETEETETETEAVETDECNLNEYLVGPESNMPFMGVMAPFPEEEISYPSDWPQDFIYPEKFVLVEQGSGKLTEESAMMYKASLLYEKKPPEAACDVIKYFEGKNWEVSKFVNRDDLGYIGVFMDKDGVGTSLLNIEVAFGDYDRSQVSLSVFPDAMQTE